IEFQEDSDQPKDSKGWHCILDQEKCEPPFFLRNFSDGDRIVSSGKERKLKELFLEKGIPSEWRRCLPLVCDRKKILWIPGILLDERARVQDNSKSIHFISARKC
ncbi:MAG: tRNA lysidine(34) synthetase TilS, partial [Candidatus Atribacteria bacterium]|nr:tRNA lysidine(34) synthetase TilS [Candidatus Atribacteria bacterium]